MNRLRVFAIASSLVVVASIGGVASVANSKLATPTARTALSALSIGGGGDDGSGSDDGGSLGKVVHGKIGSALPGKNAAGQLRSLGSDD